jgi:hypothetical protein
VNTELFHPSPIELPALIRPARGSIKMLRALEKLDWSSLGAAQNGELARAGALWLHGFLDESHVIAQGIGSAEGSYWHALMHRSEGDFSNSKYWYCRVGRHAIFPDLLAAARRLEVTSSSALRALLRSAEWDPYSFVDALERAASNATEDASLLQAMAREEYNLLMSWCLAKPEVLLPGRK